MQAIIDEEVAKMKRKRIIELLRVWSSLIVVVKKKDDKPRFCVHYRNVTEFEVTPIRCHKFPPHWINCAEKNLLLFSIYRTDIGKCLYPPKASPSRHSRFLQNASSSFRWCRLVYISPLQRFSYYFTVIDIVHLDRAFRSGGIGAQKKTHIVADLRSLVHSYKV